MHETLITRGDCGGREDLLSLIYVPENCTLLHTHCHVQATREDVRKKIVELLLQEEGYHKVKEWLYRVRDEFTSDAPEQALALIDIIYWR